MSPRQVNDCQLHFASAFFADTEDAPATNGARAEDQVEPDGVMTRAAAAEEEGWPDVAELAFEGEAVDVDEDEEDASPGDIEEDLDDLPASDLAALRVAAQAEVQTTNDEE